MGNPILKFANCLKDGKVTPCTIEEDGKKVWHKQCRKLLKLIFNCDPKYEAFCHSLNWGCGVHHIHIKKGHVITDDKERQPSLA